MIIAIYLLAVHAGIRLLGGNEMTDIQEASALGHMNDIIDIYSNSWGPPDSGFLIGTPDTLLKRTFEGGVRQVTGLLCT